MTTRVAPALFALLAVGAACRQDPKPAPTPTPPAKSAGSDVWGAQPASDPLPRPLLWSVEKDGHTSYAFGTFHMGIDPTTRLPPLVWQKLDASSQFAMETDLSDQAVARDLSERKDGGTLEHDLGEAYWHKLEGALGPKVAQRLDGMTPTVAATMVSMRDIPPTAPMDGVLLAHAQNHQKPVVFLEPVAVQIRVLTKWLDVRALEEMLDDLDLGEQRSKAMVAAYGAGDDAKILALSDSERDEWKKFGRSDAEYDQMMDEMLYARNASWIDAIEHMHASGGGFIAVGAMHLIGPKSVLELLRAKGYKVTRLTP